MLTITRTTTLHIFPLYGDWQPTDQVEVVTTVGDMPISEAYNYIQFHHGTRLMNRDSVFEIIHLPEFRSRYDDVILYAEPYRSVWCYSCQDDRFPLERDGVESKYDVCDACGCLLDAPF